MTTSSVVVHRDAELLAQAVAARLIVRLIDAQAKRGTAGVVLTGGRIADRIHKAVRDSPARDAVDWSLVDFWWGDERFLPSGDAERNETQVRESLLSALPVEPKRVHAMPASDGPDGEDPEAAAARYAADLADAAPGDLDLPVFDVVMLGVGEDGHVASLFPGHPAVYDERTAVAVRGAPKPPPTRVSLTHRAINSGREVWLLGSGFGKATAVGRALSGGGPVQIPAAGAHGTKATRWLLDADAAIELPPRFHSLNK
ncbi:6-phosphogluconolactonase [Actinorhabdospora filicis]|uniref:6-phosphogluconolactonase n=1 Tax=Actinorhabdospora filicis TaxID=1785913 RepID=A0A9W6SMX8_9ACTN|nr:6-phosphogluconolactonase [Actinorhabdospora filicis]GLZ78928.1 6-phosphogluconolactonase [Actinorhabdospora filicis]